MEIEKYKLKSNGQFSIVKSPYEKRQHPNQQSGLDMYVDVLNHNTGRIGTVKLYQNSNGLHFKFDGTHYLDEFVYDYMYVPFQMVEIDESEQAEQPEEVKVAIRNLRCIGKTVLSSETRASMRADLESAVQLLIDLSTRSAQTAPQPEQSGLVEALPYQTLFNAIAAATKSIPGTGHISISVKAFRAALTAQRGEE